MRKALQKISKDKQNTVFTGYFMGVRYQRAYVTNITVYDHNGKDIVGKVNHNLLRLSAFKSFKIGQKVRFTGKVKDYHRSDSSKDFMIIVNKAVAIE